MLSLEFDDVIILYSYVSCIYLTARCAQHVLARSVGVLVYVCHVSMCV